MEVARAAVARAVVVARVAAVAVAVAVMVTVTVAVAVMVTVTVAVAVMATVAVAAERVTVWVSRSNRHYSTFHNSSSTLERGDGPSPQCWNSSCSLRTSHIAHNGGGGRGSTTAERSNTACSTKKLVNVQKLVSSRSALPMSWPGGEPRCRGPSARLSQMPADSLRTLAHCPTRRRESAPH